MKVLLPLIIELQIALLILIIETEEDHITELEYNLSVAQTQLQLYKSLPPLETK